LLQSTCGENADVTAASGFANGGSVTLTNGDGCGNNVTLDVSSGMLTNSGTLTSEKDNGGARTLQGEVTNTGTLAIDADTAYNVALTTLTNEGALEIAAGIVLTAEKGASVTNGAGGKIVGAGSGDVLETGSGGTFTEGAGSTSGTLPVIVDDAALDYTGAGAGPIALRGTSSLAGSLSSGQSLAIQSTCGENATVTAAASFANAGSITLTNGDGCGDNATLDTSSGTLTNSGTLTTEKDNGGARTLQGDIVNTGTIAIDANTSFDTIEATLANRGTIEIATGLTLSAPDKETIGNESGTIAGVGTGALLQETGTFDQGAGKTSGTEPVILEEVNLRYTGSGASTVAARRDSTLSGNPAKGQVLTIQSTCSNNATMAAVSGFVNSGTITLTNGDGCGNNATLKLTEGTLENKGTIEAEAASGGARTIEGAVKNEKTVLLGASATLKVVGSYSQGKKGALEVAIDSASSYGSMSVSGATTVGGALSLVVLKTFKASLGQKYAILTTPSLSGTFATEKKAAIKKGVPEGLYFRPVYSAGGLTLEVAPITLVPSKAEGAPGSTVTLSGSAYPPADTVTLTFTDHAKVKTTLPSVKTSAGGTFSTEFTIPAGAAAGVATFEAKSKETGVKVKATFTVS
jgi:filamentous hemagglutinin